MLLPAMTNGTPRDPPLPYVGWSREARLIGLSDAELMFWSNVWIQAINGFFVPQPHRAAVAPLHLPPPLLNCSSALGCDFYGRPTSVWFHIPERSRKLIATNLLLSCASLRHPGDAVRLPDYNSLPPILPVNVTFVLDRRHRRGDRVRPKRLQKPRPLPPGSPTR